MENLCVYLQKAVKGKCSDLFIIAGKAVSALKDGELIPLSDEKLTPEESESMVRELYQLSGQDAGSFEAEKDDDFALSIPGLARFRVNAYRQRGSRAAVIRIVHFGIPDWRQIHIPENVMNVSKMKSGLVLVTGPAGSGRSTTLACMVDAINCARAAHIITIEDPIEYLHQNQKGVVSQRELGVDTGSSLDALRASLRQAPQVIVMENLSEPDVIQTALTAAESGRLVISTLYTMGAGTAIQHMLDCFPEEKQRRLRIQLAQVLQAVITQQMVPGTDGGQVPAFEVLYLNNALRGMIQEGRIAQIDAAIQGLAMEGMVSMDAALLELYRNGQITRESAIHAAVYGDRMQKKLRLLAE